jgi:hypothetical protein
MMQQLQRHAQQGVGRKPATGVRQLGVVSRTCSSNQAVKTGSCSSAGVHAAKRAHASGSKRRMHVLAAAAAEKGIACGTSQ